jgi:hypothetical protein
MTVLRDSFRKYIENTPMQNTTLGIEILYTDRADQISPKRIFIVRRVRPGQPEQEFKIINNTRVTRPRSDYVPTDEPFERSGTVFRNNQLKEVVKKLRRKNILQISLCEVYHDGLINNREYSPYTMEVKVLYRNISRELRNRAIEAYATRRQEIVLSTQRRMTERDEARQRETYERAQVNPDITLINQLLNDINVAVTAQDRDEARRLREQLLNIYITLTTRFSPTDPAQEMLQEYISDLREILNEVNPNQLRIVPAPDNTPPIGSASYPDMCVICQEPVVGEGCRVNCPAGHIYHCDCINGYRNSRAGNDYYDSGWHNDCPFCRQPISQMYQVNIPEGFTTGFGRRRSNFGEMHPNVVKLPKNVGTNLKELKGYNAKGSFGGIVVVSLNNKIIRARISRILPTNKRWGPGTFKTSIGGVQYYFKSEGPGTFVTLRLLETSETRKTSKKVTTKRIKRRSIKSTTNTKMSLKTIDRLIKLVQKM